MAWYSLWKWYVPWSKKELFMEDMIWWYKEYVLKTSEQRELEAKERGARRKQAIASLVMMGAMCKRIV